MLTHDQLVAALKYDPISGVFTWLIALSRRVKIGEEAGSVTGKYRRVKLYGKYYAMHMLAWFYVHGIWPTNLIDHKDTDGLNNAIENLREADYTNNAGNKSIAVGKKHGFKGVSKNRHQFAARICKDGKNRYIGYYATAEEAARAYDEAAIEQFGVFARTNKMLGLLP